MDQASVELLLPEAGGEVGDGGSGKEGFPDSRRMINGHGSKDFISDQSVRCWLLVRIGGGRVGDDGEGGES